LQERGVEQKAQSSKVKAQSTKMGAD